MDEEDGSSCWDVWVKLAKVADEALDWLIECNIDPHASKEIRDRAALRWGQVVLSLDTMEQHMLSQLEHI